MDKIMISEVFKDIHHSLPIGINKDQKVKISLPGEEVTPDSLIFYTERMNGEDPPNISFQKQKPYAIVVSNTHKIIDSSVPVIRVSSVRQAFANACSNAYGIDYSKLKVIGVTGTNGKTSTASIIARILKEVGFSVGFIGTGKVCINDRIITDNTYTMTTPDPTELYRMLADMYKEGCEYVIMEVSSHSLALKKVAPIKFEYAVFTNLNSEHMDFHRDMEEYYRVKLGLFDQAKWGLFNLDDKYARRAYNEVKCKKSSVGIIHDADAYATDISGKGAADTFFYYREPNLMFGIRSKLNGAFNVYNSLCALKCVIDIGIKPCLAKRAFEKIEAIEGRMQLIKSDVSVVIDYAHTPEALYNLIKSLISMNINRQNIVLVFGCGGNRDKQKRSMMGKTASEYANKIILTEDNNRDESFADIISDIAKGIEYKEYRVIRDRESAIRAAISEASVGDIIAIIGKGHEKYKIDHGKIIPFDEERIVKDALERRGRCHADKA